MRINRILLKKGRKVKSEYVYITSDGGRIIYNAYSRMFGSKKSMIDLEIEGFLVDITILKRLKLYGEIPEYFDFNKYKILSQEDACNKYCSQMYEIRKKNGYLKGNKKTVSESELALLARSMIKRMKSSQKDIAVRVGVTTPTLSRMLNGQTPIGKTYSQIKMLFNTWRAKKIDSLRSEIAILKKYKT